MATTEDLICAEAWITGGGQADATLAIVPGLTVLHRKLKPIIYQSTFTLVNVPQAITSAAGYIGTLLFTFPKSRISIIDTTTTLQQTTTSALASTLNASSTGAFGLGTVTASATTLATTMQNIAPVTAVTSSATINVSGTAVKPVLAAPVQLDGSTTAVPLFLNCAYSTALSGNATQTVSGTIVVTWLNLGIF